MKINKSRSYLNNGDDKFKIMFFTSQESFDFKSDLYISHSEFSYVLLKNFFFSRFILTFEHYINFWSAEKNHRTIKKIRMCVCDNVCAACTVQCNIFWQRWSILFSCSEQSYVKQFLIFTSTLALFFFFYETTRKMYFHNGIR